MSFFDISAESGLPGQRALSLLVKGSGHSKKVLEARDGVFLLRYLET